VSATAPGYSPFQKTVNEVPGYPVVVALSLPPAGRDVTGSPMAAPETVPDTFTRAQAAEQQKEFDVAEAGYNTTIAAHPDFEAAYESLAALERRQSRIGEYVGTLVDLNGVNPPTAHSLSILATAYAQYCLQGASASTGDSGGHKGKDYPFPKSQKDAGDLGVKTANAAIALDGTLAEAQRSLGFAIVAQDSKLKNEQSATKAFSQAVFMDGNDATNLYGLGYCKRYYAQQIKDKDAQTARLQDAITYLDKAIALRPQYYEAHRELAYWRRSISSRRVASVKRPTATKSPGRTARCRRCISRMPTLSPIRIRSSNTTMLRTAAFPMQRR
jgi:tetratricopeptide (TPR) repeat protein